MNGRSSCTPWLICTLHESKALWRCSSESTGENIDVASDRKFLGFAAY